MEKYVNDLVSDNQFYVKDLVAALATEGVTAEIGQSGGGTATLYVELDRYCADGKDYFLIGPGSYNWSDAPMSTMTTDELYCGEDGSYHMEPKDWTVAPGTSIPDAAKQIAGWFREVSQLGYSLVPTPELATIRKALAAMPRTPEQVKALEVLDAVIIDRV